jgi:nucleotide-binding universal stress UspA family protein
MNVKTILVPLDGSALAQAALPPAVDLARERGAKLVLVRAAEAHTLPMADPIEGQVKAVRRAEEYLAAIRDGVAEAGVHDVDVSVWYGPPAEAIVEAARFRHADLIVMSTHGRSGLGRLMLGSVAESVLRATPVPILLIPSRVAAETAATIAARELSHV